MKKIPSLFQKEYDKFGKIKRVCNWVKPELQWVLDGDGEATEKVDGSACAVINGKLYRRYDAKKGRTFPPHDGIPCQSYPDEVTGHWPWWIPCKEDRQEDKWYIRAYIQTPWYQGIDGTYEAVGPHFQRNPYGLDEDLLEKHGRIKIHDCPRTYEGIKEYLRTHEIEGIVWWLNGEPKCKMKRTDFGFEWPILNNESEEEDA